MRFDEALDKLISVGRKDDYIFPYDTSPDFAFKIYIKRDKENNTYSLNIPEFPEYRDVSDIGKYTNWDCAINKMTYTEAMYVILLISTM